MNAARHELPPLSPSPQDAEVAACIGRGPSVRLRVVDGDGEIEVPVAGLRMPADILAPMAEGSTISLVPIHAELTTQQAGGFPGVSPPHLVKRVEQRLLPHHKLGRRRRICFRDLLEYCKTRMAQSQAVLEALAEQTQKLNLGS